MHLEILNIAYKHLLSYNKYNVLCAFISPSADCYVKYKGSPFIPFESRCDLVETAIEEFEEENKDKEETIKIYLNKWEGSHSYFIDFPEVIHEIQQKLNTIGDIKLIYVCGIDHYIKCFGSFPKNVIAIDRKPYKIDSHDERYQDIPEKLIFIIKDENSEPYSSTSIREAYLKGDLDTIKNCTFPKVAEKIIKIYEEIYSENKINQYGRCLYCHKLFKKNQMCPKREYENIKKEEKDQYGYITIFLKQEIFKFYPFRIHELQLLLTALYSLTGIIPIRQEQQVKAVLMRKIENVRREVLLYLVKQESPWITTSNELFDLL